MRASEIRSRTQDATREGVRRGFALPLAILALALVSATMIAGYAMTASEITANNATRAQDRAYQLAEAGLQEFFVRRGEGGFCTACFTDPSLVDSEWTRVSLHGGYADVVAMRVRPERGNDEPALFFVRSTGVDTLARLSAGGFTTFATRTVGTYASWGTGVPVPLSALTALNGITNNTSGNSTRIDGDDACNEEDDVAGVSVPAGSQFGGSGGRPDGDPDIDSTSTLAQLIDRVGIDWNRIRFHNGIPVDITIPPSDEFPSFWTWILNPGWWPVIRVTESMSIPRDGRGIIIADGDLSLGTGVDWDGIILVGGKLTVSGSGTISGAVVTGLNLTLDGATDPGPGVTSDNTVSQNSRRFEYNSCYIASATSRLRRYFEWPNAWIDNISDW